MTDNRIRAVEFLRILDGDTFEGRWHLLPGVKPKIQIVASLRVNGWNAAELREDEGPYMRDEFAKQLMLAKLITVRVIGMSFERIVGDVYLDGVLFTGILRRLLKKFRTQKIEP
jgi:hypothetical protein